MADRVIPTQLDYKKYPYVTPDYQLSKLIQQTGGQTIATTAAGGQESIFEIPAKVLNLSKSELKFTLNIPEVNTKFAYALCNVLPWWQQIQVYTRGGLMLCDLVNANNYTNLVVPVETKIDEFITYDQGDYGTAAARTGMDGYSPGFRPAGPYASNRRPDSATVATNGQNEMLYTFVGVAGNGGGGGGNGQLTNKFSIPLSLFKNTILDLDKDLYFGGEVVLMRFVWAPFTRFYFTADSATDPTSTPVAAANAVAISDLALYIALQQNQDIQQDVMDKCKSREGLSLLVPYVHQNKINLGVSTSQSISLRYNRAHGLTLKKIFHGVYHNTETGPTSFQHKNVLGATVPSYYTMLDNNRRQQFNVDCTNGEDYLLVKNKLKGSMLITYDVFGYNWVIIEDFSDMRPQSELPMKPDESNLITGVSLDTERKIDIYLTTASAAYNHYSFAVTEKILVVSANGMTFV